MRNVAFGPRERLALSGFLILFVILQLSQRSALTSTVPPWPLLLAALAALALSFDRVPTIGWLWWLLGALSLLWSLAPGNSYVWVLWTPFFLAAMALGRWPIGFLLLNLVLLYNNLERALALNYFGLESYLSGSIHYVTGAQALILIPIAFAAALRSKRPWLAAAATLLLVVATYATLISGARAVYVPLVILALALPIRALMSGIRWQRVLLLLLLLLGGLWGFDTVLPKGGPVEVGAVIGQAGEPAGSPLTAALSTKASIEAQVAGVSNYGGIRNRLRLWHQAISAGLANPLGTGAGSFSSIVHSYQRYPMAWSSSAHNIFVETFAELGWLGLALLAALVGVPLVLVWLGPHWPIALSLFGFWFTLSVDVTSSHAYMMAIAFATLGAAYASLADRTPPRLAGLVGRPPLALAGIVVVAAGSLALFWYLPCGGVACATGRHLGYPNYSVQALQRATPEARTALLARLRELYPQSIWVVKAEAAFAAETGERLRLAREVAERFPHQSPVNYLTWARFSAELGDMAQARTALERGFDVFPPDRLPFSEMRLTPAQYRSQWLEPAQALLVEIH